MGNLIGVYVLIGFMVFLVGGYIYLKIKWSMDAKREVRTRKY